MKTPRIRYIAIGLAVALVVVDQVTKMLWSQPGIFDAGWSLATPLGFGDITNPTTGAWADAAGMVALVGAWAVALRWARGWTLLAAATMLAGITGNAIDRLGLSVIVTNYQHPRGVPNFFGVWYLGNLADVFTYVGGGLLLAGAVLLLARHLDWRPTQIRMPSWRRVAAGSAAAVAVFGATLALTSAVGAASTNALIVRSEYRPTPAQVTAILESPASPGTTLYGAQMDSWQWVSGAQARAIVAHDRRLGIDPAVRSVLTLRRHG